ncbi:MAG: hypothetical protein ACREE4_22880, partial [Stellaceae bacterium]
ARKRAAHGCVCLLLSEGTPAAAPSNDPRIAVYRVVDATELAYLRMTGNYGSNPNRSGKYFARSLSGAAAFAASPMNAGSMITETTLPQSVVKQGWSMIDPGPNGAGISVYFAEVQLPMVYGAMTPPVIL